MEIMIRNSFEKIGREITELFNPNNREAIGSSNIEVKAVFNNKLRSLEGAFEFYCKGGYRLLFKSIYYDITSETERSLKALLYIWRGECLESRSLLKKIDKYATYTKNVSNTKDWVNNEQNRNFLIEFSDICAIDQGCFIATEKMQLARKIIDFKDKLENGNDYNCVVDEDYALWLSSSEHKAQYKITFDEKRNVVFKKKNNAVIRPHSSSPIFR